MGVRESWDSKLSERQQFNIHLSRLTDRLSIKISETGCSGDLFRFAGPLRKYLECVSTDRQMEKVGAADFMYEEMESVDQSLFLACVPKG